MKIYDKGLKFEGEEEPIIETYDRTYTKHQGVIQIRTETDTPEAEETTVEVITRPFEIEQTSRIVSVTREMKKLPTPPPEQITVMNFIRLNTFSTLFISDY